MRRRAMICVAFLLLSVVGHAFQNRVRGQIRDSNGGPQAQCQIDFYRPNQPNLMYRVYSDQGGFFYLDNPERGPYSVTVSQGNRSNRFDVTITNSLNPEVLVVRW